MKLDNHSGITTTENSFWKARIISDFVSEDYLDQAKGFDNFLELLTTCSTTEQNKKKIKEEVSLVLHMNKQQKLR